MLTIAYQTNRREPMIHWFFQSLRNQAGADFSGINIVIVDFFAAERNPRPADFNVRWIEPKPTPWQGRYRLTSRDYFAAANARNTAICHAPDGHIAFVDDISVLMPGWLDRVRHACTSEDSITLGRYAKVRNLVVQDGNVVSHDDTPEGVDSRYDSNLGTAVRQVTGAWMYGCSLVAPVAAMLKINGFDEMCDGIGSEDYIAGMMLEKNGYRLFYDQGMVTLESEERHHVEAPFLRTIKPYVQGVSKFHEKDSSHALLGMLERGRIRATNTFDLAELRQRILGGGEFPTGVNPQHDWCDGQPLSEM